MKGVLSIFLVLIFTTCAVIFIGCSDDEKVTGPTGIVPGNPVDWVFLLTKSIIIKIDQSHGDMIPSLIDLYGLVLPGKRQAPVYHEGSKYWYYEHTDTTSYGIEISHDSIQLLHSGVPVQFSDSALLTEIKGGVDYVLIDTATTEGISAVAAVGDTLLTVGLTFDMTGAAGEIAGYGDVSIDFTSISSGLPEGMSSDCETNVNFTAVGTDLLRNLSNISYPCPTSGTIVHNGTVIWACPIPAPSFSNTWTATQTFEGETISWRIENENYYWEYDGYCYWH